MNKKDLSEAAKVLGAGTSYRFLSNPYPLGGYTGLEVGYSFESVPVEDLYYLNNSNSDRENNVTYSRMTFGKGLFYDIDLFVHFAPFTNSPRMSDYGGALKWNFYQAQFIPLSFSFLTHFNTVNIQDNFTNQTFGLELIGGVNVDNFALYIGGGTLHLSSLFMKNILNFCTAPNTPVGCDASYDSNIDSEKTKETVSHSFIGIHFNFWKMFLSAQVDRYTEPVYSLKLGYRM